MRNLKRALSLPLKTTRRKKAMRNLKRALSLALAAIMVLGLMIVSAGAADTYEDFTDKDEIQHSEAVATMVALGVIEGKEDGSYFDPTGTVTRAEMAKIVAVSLSGGVDPVTGSGSTSVQFSDVPTTHWAYKYISFCVQQNIIAGRGNGTFGPEDPVTGSAAAKMFLCALGYSSEYHGLTGNDWEINTNVLANQNAKLYDGLSGIDASAGLSRDNTAQMVYNAVQADEIDYTDGSLINGVPPMKSNGTMLANRFGVIKYTGIVAANDEFALGTTGVQKNGKTALRDWYYYNTKGDKISATAGTTASFNVAVDSSLIGQEVVIYVKPASQLNPNPSSDAVLGQAIVTDKNTVVTTTADYTASNKESAWNNLLRQGDLNTDTSATVVYDNYSTINGTLSRADTGNGIEITVIDNTGDGTADLAIRLTKNLSKITNLNEEDEKLILAGVTDELDFDDVANLDSFAKDDMVMYLLANGTYHLYEVTTVEGMMSAFVKDKNITVDETVYEASALNMNGLTTIGQVYDFSVGDGVSTGFTGLSSVFDSTYRFYLDANNSIIAYELVEAGTGDYAVILSSGASVSTLGNTYSGEVKLLYADGTTATKSVNMTETAKKFNGLTPNNGNAGVAINKDDVSTLAQNMANSANSADIAGYKDSMNGLIVTYTEDSDGNVVLHPANNVTTGAAGDKITSTSASATIDGQSVVLNSSTIFLYAYDSDNNGTIDKYAAVTGVNKIGTAGITDAKVKDVAFNKTTKVAEIVFVSGEGPGTADATLAYIKDNTSVKVEGGTTYYYYNAITEDGEAVSLKSTDDVRSYEKGIVEYAANADGTYEMTGYDVDDSAAPGANEYAKGYIKSAGINGNTITVVASNGNSYSFLVGSDVPVWNVTGTSVSEGSLSDLQEVAIGVKVDGSNHFDGVKVVYITKNMTDNMVTSAASDLAAAFQNSSNVTFTGTTIGSGTPLNLGSGQTLTLTGAVTDISGLTGTGKVVLSRSGSISDSLADCYASLGSTVAAPSDPSTTTTLPAALKLSGAGDIDNYWDGKSLDDIASGTGSSTVSFKTITFTSTQARQNCYIKGERYVNGSWVAMEGDLSDGQFKMTDADGWTLVCLLGDKVEQIRITISQNDNDFSNGDETVYTFTNAN